MTRPTNRPTHRVNLVIDRGRNRDAEFIEIGAVWPTERGDGMTLELQVDLRRGDRLYLREIDWDAIDAERSRAQNHAAPEAVQ